jgi:hypothetical protein
MSRRRRHRRRDLRFGHVPRVDRGLGRPGAMAALCHRRRSACRARSKQAEHRRLATAPCASLLGPTERAQEPSSGRFSAAGKLASNPLHQLLGAALLGLPAAPARRLSLTGGAATKTALSLRRGFPPRLCRPSHDVPPWTGLQDPTARARRPVIQTDSLRISTWGPAERIRRVFARSRVDDAENAPRRASRSTKASD